MWVIKVNDNIWRQNPECHKELGDFWEADRSQLRLTDEMVRRIYLTHIDERQCLTIAEVLNVDEDCEDILAVIEV